ncbi:MAG: NAD-dependent epimerase/dehydratase family protein [Acetobacterium woodii]|nr:NAD-dependent epimerase/dehydratase family protein [Acetobacterium woodii]MBI5677808.1 NAD-dependent epimerase/dehydratase family protein [Planctomycetota bacterium]
MTRPIVQEDIECIFKIVGNDLNRLQGKRVLITGGTGFIGTWLLETISWLNKNSNQPCRVYVPTRNPEAFARKALHLASNPGIVLLPADITDFKYPDDKCDFIIHAAAPESEERAEYWKWPYKKISKVFYLSVPGQYIECSRLIWREFLRIILAP